MEADLEEAFHRKTFAELIGIRRGRVGALVHKTPAPVLSAARGCLAGVEHSGLDLEAVSVFALCLNERAVGFDTDELW